MNFRYGNIYSRRVNFSQFFVFLPHWILTSSVCSLAKFEQQKLPQHLSARVKKHVHLKPSIYLAVYVDYRRLIYRRHEEKHFSKRTRLTYFFIN